MKKGSSNRVALRLGTMAAGVVPGNPTMKALRFTGESLVDSIEFKTSDEIRADRMTSDTILVAASAAGSINGELYYGGANHDLLEAALFSTWDTTGTDIAAATDIGIVKTPGTPNTWQLTSTTSTFTGKNWVVGQVLKVTGFTVAGDFYAVITSIAANALGIAPLTDVASEAAADEVTIAPLDVLRNGTTKKDLFVQKAFTDLDTPEFHNFIGAVVGEWSFEAKTGSILTTAVSLMALSAAMTETQYPGATIEAAPTTTAMNAVTNVVGIVFDNDAGDQRFFSTVSLKLNNTTRGQSAIGVLGFIGIEPGRLDATGSVELYFENSADYDRFKNADDFALSLALEDEEGNAYVLSLPRAKFTKLEITAGGLDQDIFAKGEFQGIADTTSTYQVQVCRYTAA